MTSLGIGLAVGLVVLLLALSAGVETSVTTLATESGVDLFATAGSYSPGGSVVPIAQAHRLASEMPTVDSNVQTASPWLISDLVFANSSLWARANNSSVPADWSWTGSYTIGYIPSDNFGLQIPDLYNGTRYTVAGDPYYGNGQYNGTPTHEIVLDQGLAEALHVWVHSWVWVGAAQPTSNADLEQWFATATSFQVVGISGPFWLIPSATLAYLYLSEMQRIVGGGTPQTDYATVVLIHLEDPTRVTNDQSVLASHFPELKVITLAEILGSIQHVVNLYRTFGDLIGAIGIVVAALFATTILQMSVDDRSRELALLRAIGHSRSSVGRMVVEEGLVLSLLGLAAGLPVAFGAGYALNWYLERLIPGLPTAFTFVSFDPVVLADGLALVLAVGLVAAIAPAARAMQLPVAEELRAP